jgi:hypothetical protein
MKDLGLDDDTKYQFAALIKQRDIAALKRQDAKVECVLASAACTQAKERLLNASNAFNTALDEELKARDSLERALGLKA